MQKARLITCAVFIMTPHSPAGNTDTAQKQPPVSSKDTTSTHMRTS